MVPRMFVVERNQMETGDSFTLKLQPADPLTRFTFEPGQFNMVYAYGVGEIPVSISGDPDNSSFLVHTVRDVGAVTHTLRLLRQGNAVGIRGPFGRPWPTAIAEGGDVVLIAGGIGLAPLRPALYRVLARREEYGRVAVLYGARTPADILFAKELASWRGQFDLEVFVTVDRASSDWRGNVGVVTQLISRASFDPDEATAMICGPEIMMRYCVEELQERGMGADAIFLSMERNMKCGVGLCGHCQIRSTFVCRDGPVYSYAEIEPMFLEREL